MTRGQSRDFIDKSCDHVVRVTLVSLPHGGQVHFFRLVMVGLRAFLCGHTVPSSPISGRSPSGDPLAPEDLCISMKWVSHTPLTWFYAIFRHVRQPTGTRRVSQCLGHQTDHAYYFRPSLSLLVVSQDGEEEILKAITSEFLEDKMVLQRIFCTDGVGKNPVGYGPHLEPLARESQTHGSFRR